MTKRNNTRSIDKAIAGNEVNLTQGMKDAIVNARAESVHKAKFTDDQLVMVIIGMKLKSVGGYLPVASALSKAIGDSVTFEDKNLARSYIVANHHKIDLDKPKQNSSQKPNPQTKSRKRHIRKNAREEMARFFGCGKYSSTLILGQFVAKHLELPVPGTKAESVRLVVERYKDVLNSGKAAEGGKLCGGSGDDFYKSSEWRELRYSALRNCEGRCQCCGATAADGEQIHVDHIKPRSKYPELALDLDNLGILCGSCNSGKSNYYEDDWRGLTKL